MKSTIQRSAGAMALALALCSPAQSGEMGNAHHGHASAHGAADHAPIGVMGDHMHPKGEWMLSYRYMNMQMDGSRIGTNDVTPEQIATTVPNRFFGAPMQPPTLRVVPTNMTMQMHMVGAMYAPTDWLTLMGMGNYTIKEMDHVTFQGAAGTNVLGSFTTKSSGIGDTKVSGLVRLFEDGTHHLHFNGGLSLPTGSIDEEDDVLTPTGARPTLRLPYPMQLGSGTFDLLPGLTYTGQKSQVSWGAQYTGTFRLGENEEDYRLGHVHTGTLWAAYQWLDWVSTSFRVEGKSVGKISGIDTDIVAPVQTADPDNAGGDTVYALFGLNLLGQQAVVKGHRLAAEFGIPLYRNLNGPQLETDYTFTLGWQKAF